MQLTKEQILDLRRYLKRNAPVIDRLEERMSRRIEGEIEIGSGDARGYRAVVVYMERGFGNQDQLVRQVFHTVAAIQAEYCLQYPVCLFSFGWDDGNLHHGGRSHDGSYYSNVKAWVQELCNLAGTDATSSGIIPSLFPLADPYGQKLAVGRDDLLVFFCRNPNAQMHEQARKQYSPQIARHSIWLSDNGGNTDMEMGKVVQCDQNTQPLIESPADGSGEDTRCGIQRYLDVNNLETACNDLGFLVELVKSYFPDIEICIRRNYLNLYYRGNSLAKIQFAANGNYNIAISNEFYDKSPMDNSTRYQKKSTNNHQAHLEVQPKELRHFFAKTHLADLCRRIKTRNYCEEISAEQLVMVDNRGRTDFMIIDRQVAFPGVRDIRMDLLALRQVKPNSIDYRLEVMEVKLGNNADLKGNVADQLERYVSHIEANFESYRQCYEKHYEQKVALGLISGSCHKSINIILPVTGLVVVTGYLGTARPILEELAKKHKDLRVIPLALSIPTSLPE